MTAVRARKAARNSRGLMRNFSFSCSGPPPVGDLLMIHETRPRGRSDGEMRSGGYLRDRPRAGNWSR